MAVPSVVVFTLERNSPGLYRPYPSATPRRSYSENRQFGEVVPTVDSDVSSLKCGVEAECVDIDIATDVVHLSEHGAWLVHHYRVYGDCVSHSSLRGTFMANLSDFTNRACAEARSVAKRGRDSSTESSSSPSRPAPSPLGPTHRTPDHDPPAWKAAQDVASATSPDDAGISSMPMSPLPLGFARRTQLALFRPGQPCMTSLPAGVVAATAFRHTGFSSETGYCTVALSRDPFVPIVAGVPVVDPLLGFGRI